MSKIRRGGLVLLTAICLAAPAWAAPAGTKFTYQGKLKLSGSPVTGSVDLQFSLFDAVTGGTQIGSTTTLSSVTVTGGLFEVELDYGLPAFDGSARWLEIEVRKPSGVGSYVLLTPRQPIDATPYSLHAEDAVTDVVANEGLEGGGGPGVVTVGIADDGVTPPKIALPFSKTFADPGPLWELINPGSGAAISGLSTGGNGGIFESTTSIPLVAQITVAANPSDAMQVTSNSTIGHGLTSTLTDPTKVNKGYAVRGLTSCIGSGGFFANTNLMPGAPLGLEGVIGSAKGTNRQNAGVHAIGGGPAVAAAALSVDTGAINVAGPVPMRAVQSIPVGGGWIPIVSCTTACTGCVHSHVIGFYTDVPFASPLIIVGAANAADTMIIPSIETLSAMPPQVSYNIQLHSRIAGSCVFRVTRMGDLGGCLPPTDSNRINVLMVNAF